MAKLTFNLLTDFEVNGIWWLPSQPDKRFSGTLFYKHEDEMTLEIQGSFRDIRAFGRVEASEQEIILGLTDDGKQCTLYNNFETRSQLNLPGITKTVFLSQYLFVGKHFNSVDDLSFTSMMARFTNLESWLAQNPFKTDFKFEEREWTVSYTFPDKIEVDIADAKIRTTYGYNTNDNLFTSIERHHTAYFEIAPKDAQGLNYYWAKIFDLNNLLTLLIGQTTYTKKITAMGDEITIAPGKKTRETIDILYTQRKPTLKENIHPFEMIAPLPRISNKVSTVISLWFSNADKLRSVYDLFFGTFFNPGMYLQFHFLSLMQALESYHRVSRGGKYLTDVDWKPYKDKIMASIPPELESGFKESLKSRIKYGNEYSLRKRIGELISSLDDTVKAALSPSANYFSGPIVNTRNFLTHYDDELKPLALDGNDLYYANGRLKVLMIILLLREIGIEDTEALTMLRESRQYGFIIESTSPS